MSDQFSHKNSHEIVLKEERDNIQKVLGNPPGWALRWGITAVFIGMLMFLALGWFIHYPDVITARTVIITENPPIRLFARSHGKVSQIFAEDKEWVAEGQPIALLENPANFAHIDSLEKIIDHLSVKMHPADVLDYELPTLLALGQLQSTFAAFQQSLSDFQFYAKQQGVFAQITSIKEQITYIEELNVTLRQRETTLAREVEIAQKNYERNKTLLSEGAISELDLEKSETFYLQYRRQLETLQSEILNNGLQSKRLEVQIIDLTQGQSNLTMSKWLTVQELFERLKSELTSWKQTYLLISPISGRLSLTRVWGAQQFVQMNEEVATIVPDRGTNEIIGKAMLPIQNSGKVKLGMAVNIQLDGYPYHEFGTIQAKVNNMALIPDKETYLVELEMPNALVTTYHRTIPFAQELTGNARIITEDRRILDRIFDQLLNLFKNK